MRERKQWFDILMKKEKRGRRSRAIPLHICSGSLSKKSYNFLGTRMTMSNGVLRFDGHLTDAIYVLKSTGRFILGDILRCLPIILPIPQLP